MKHKFACATDDCGRTLVTRCPAKVPGVKQPLSARSTSDRRLSSISIDVVEDPDSAAAPRDLYRFFDLRVPEKLELCRREMMRVNAGVEARIGAIGHLGLDFVPHGGRLVPEKLH
jgi:hypothetical protein